jgi:chondroitin AC lyase
MYPRTVNNSGETRFIGAEPLKSGANWTNGFYPGILWMLYAHTGDLAWKVKAEKVTRALEVQKDQIYHHDIGFIIMSSFGKAYEYSPSEYYRNIIIHSAESQLTRFSEITGTTRSWDKWTSRGGTYTTEYPVIIDNLMNLDLLFKAYELTGDDKFLKPALSHADKTMANHIREDGSAYHLVAYDPETGEVDARKTSQGFSDSSAWSRGQAWAIYGFTMCYRFTRNPDYLATAMKAADFFINHKNLPEDFIPYWDFNIGEFSDYEWAYDPARFDEEPRDASAAAATASALLELKDYVDDPVKSREYRDAAVKMLKSLAAPEYMAEKGQNNYFLLKHSVASVPHDSSIDKPEAYADYYFLEALLKL